MRARVVLYLCITLIIVNILIGHFFAPWGIMLTPVIVILLSILIIQVEAFSAFAKSLLLFICIAVHDIGIKLYSGGHHDWQGLGWIHMMLLIGGAPAFVILAIKILRQKGALMEDKILALILFPALMFIHLKLFGELGIGRYYE